MFKPPPLGISNAALRRVGVASRVQVYLALQTSLKQLIPPNCEFAPFFTDSDLLKRSEWVAGLVSGGDSGGGESGAEGSGSCTVGRGGGPSKVGGGLFGDLTQTVDLAFLKEYREAFQTYNQLQKVAVLVQTIGTQHDTVQHDVGTIGTTTRHGEHDHCTIHAVEENLRSRAELSIQQLDGTQQSKEGSRSADDCLDRIQTDGSVLDRSVGSGGLGRSDSRQTLTEAKRSLSELTKDQPNLESSTTSNFLMRECPRFIVYNRSRGPDRRSDPSAPF